MSTSAGATSSFRALYTDMDGVDCTDGIRLLEDAGIDVSVVESSDPEEIIAAAEGVQALLIGYAPITAETMDRLPELKIIALLSMGFDNVDIDAARERGIWVTNIPGAATEEVATHALALMLEQVRSLNIYADNAKSGQWNDRDSIEMMRLSRRTLGLVGFGRIGQKLAGYAKPLFGEVIAYDPFFAGTDLGKEIEASTGVKLVSLEELQSRSDVISLHMPLTEDTENMVDAQFLAGMRKGSYLINVSRGGLIDSKALRDAIDRGHIAGAGLDVLDEEPAPVDHPLLRHPRIVVTPHIAYLSDWSERDYVAIQANNVLAYFTEGKPLGPLFQLEAHATITTN